MNIGSPLAKLVCLVEVSQDCFKNGKRRDAWNCMAVQALKKIYGADAQIMASISHGDGPLVNYPCFRINGEEYLAATWIAERMKSFDNGEKMEPFDFNLYRRVNA